MRVAIVVATLVAALALVTPAMACFRQNRLPLEINGGLERMIPNNTRFFGIQTGATKCSNTSNPSGKALCQYNYPYQLFVEVELLNVTEPTLCATALTVDQQTSTTLRLPESLAASTFMRHEGSRIIKAEVVIMDIQFTRVIRRVPEFSFVFDEDATSVIAGTLMPMGTYNSSALLAFSTTVAQFNTSNVIYNYVSEVPFVAFSIVAQYYPLIDTTGVPAVLDQCTSFENERFFDCALPGINDKTFSGLPGHNFYDFSGILPASAQVWAGSLARTGTDEAATTSVGGPTPGAWYNASLNIKTIGLCSEDSQCGQFQRCTPPQSPPVARYCQDCLSTSECNPQFSQPFFLATCLTASANRAAFMCNYLPGPASELPAARTDPNYDLSCGISSCNAQQYCSASGCIECRTVADCQLPYTVEGTYTKQCVTNSCFYSFPSPPAFKSIRTRTAIIAGCVAGGVCLIGVVIGVVVWRMKKTKDVEADNVLHDSLSKDKAATKGKERKFTFSDGKEVDLSGKSKGDPFA